MSYESIHFIINPSSGGGNAGKIWAQARNYIEKNIGAFSFEYTAQKGHAIELAKRASEKAQKIISIGGDGTLSEVIMGVVQSGSSATLVGVLNLGTGGDFCRTVGITSNLQASLEKIKNNNYKNIDIGHIIYKTSEDRSEERYFINVAGCGMAGNVVKTINVSKKMFGSFSYYLSSLQNLFSYKNKKIQLTIDGIDKGEFQVVTAAICNGKYFGGGMHISPLSDLTDGLFHITIIGNWSLFEKVLYSMNLYGNKLLSLPKVSSFTGKKITIQPLEGELPALIDSDGEDIGVIPMTLEILPGALKFLL
jgi:YegS/Rv2252/BmrU family lipid kinase